VNAIMLNPVTALLVGYGYWGARFFGFTRRVDAVRIAGVVDARYGQDGFAGPPSLPCWGNLDAALATAPVDAVIIATPAVEHARLVRQALRAGTHVFVEKPLALSSRDADDLLDLARDRDLMLTVDHQYWWSPEVAALAEALAGGAIGAVVALFAERAAPGPVRFDVNALWDLGSHDVSTMVRVGALRAGQRRPLQVDECKEVLDGQVAGCVSLTGRTWSGIAVRIHACWMSDTRRRRLVISGEEGSLRLEETPRTLSTWLVREGRRRLLSRTVKSDRGTPIERALEEFATGVRREPDLGKAADAGRVVAALEQITAEAKGATTTVRSTRCWL
jgi:predicted dehydrogenase